MVNEAKKFYTTLGYEFEEKGVIVSFFAFGKSNCFLSSLSDLVLKTQGTICQYTNLITIPQINLPIPIKGINLVKISLITSNEIEINSLNYRLKDKEKKDTKEKNINEKDLIGNDQKEKENLVNLLSYISQFALYNSVFYFRYTLKNKHASGPIKIQVQLEYQKNKKTYLRIATDTLPIMENSPTIIFTEYDILIKYAALITLKCLIDDSEKNTIKKLEQILKLLSKQEGSSKKKEICKKIIEEKILCVKTNDSSDINIVKLFYELTTHKEYPS